jgi:hypothetical protein
VRMCARAEAGAMHAHAANRKAFETALEKGKRQNNRSLLCL